MWTCSICGKGNLFGVAFLNHQADKHDIVTRLSVSDTLPSKYKKGFTPYVRKLV